MGLFDFIFPGGVWGDDDSWKKARAKKRSGKAQAARRVVRAMGLVEPVDGTTARPARNRRPSGGGRTNWSGPIDGSSPRRGGGSSLGW